MTDTSEPDFLSSLQELFQEAKVGGFLKKRHDLFMLKSCLIQLFNDCGKMTKARARAANPIKFSDGTIPKTYITLPPAAFRIDDKKRKSLQSATSSEKFLKVVGQALGKKPERPTASASRKPRKRNIVKVEIGLAAGTPATSGGTASEAADAGSAAILTPTTDVVSDTNNISGETPKKTVEREVGVEKSLLADVLSSSSNGEALGAICQPAEPTVAVQLSSEMDMDVTELVSVATGPGADPVSSSGKMAMPTFTPEKQSTVQPATTSLRGVASYPCAALLDTPMVQETGQQFSFSTGEDGASPNPSGGTPSRDAAQVVLGFASKENEGSFFCADMKGQRLGSRYQSNDAASLRTLERSERATTALGTAHDLRHSELLSWRCKSTPGVTSQRQYTSSAISGIHTELGAHSFRDPAIKTEHVLCDWADFRYHEPESTSNASTERYSSSEPEDHAVSFLSDVPMKSIEEPAFHERRPRRIILRVKNSQDQSIEVQPEDDRSEEYDRELDEGYSETNQHEMDLCQEKQPEKTKLDLPRLISEIEAMSEAELWVNKERVMASLRMIDAMERTAVNTAVIDTPLQRLNASLVLMPDLISKFPSKTWSIYFAKLTRLFASSEASEMDFQQRLYKIGRVVYVPEEEEAIAGSDRDRFSAAARLCAMIATGTSRPGERDNLEDAKKWLQGKLSVMS